MDTQAPYCIGDVDVVDLLNELNGNPDTGGTWMDLSSAGVDLSDPQNVDISSLSAGSYDFAYVVEGSGSCADESSTLTIMLEEEPSAGMNGNSGICEGGSTLSLIHISEPTRPY